MLSGKDGGSTGDPLQTYLNEIRSITPLSRKEERQLAKRGDEKALSALVVRNLRYVVMVANRYKGMGIGLSDLINEGNIGLIEAAKRFDPERGVKFITYAVWWIRQGILRALADQSRVVRLPVKQAGLLGRVVKTIARMTQEKKREPNLDEVATEMGLKRRALETILRVYRDHMSLDSPLSNEEGSSLFMDMLKDDRTGASVEEDFISLCLSHDIAAMLDALPERERKVLRMRYGFDDAPRTLAQIGAEIGLTRERIRQIEKTAKNRLRKNANLKILEDYLR